jgi:hypothetical protein
MRSDPEIRPKDDDGDVDGDVDEDAYSRRLPVELPVGLKCCEVGTYVISDGLYGCKCKWM